MILALIILLSQTVEIDADGHRAVMAVNSSEPRLQFYELFMPTCEVGYWQAHKYDTHWCDFWPPWTHDAVLALPPERLPVQCEFRYKAGETVEFPHRFVDHMVCHPPGAILPPAKP